MREFLLGLSQASTDSLAHVRDWGVNIVRKSACRWGSGDVGSRRGGWLVFFNVVANDATLRTSALDL